MSATQHLKSVVTLGGAVDPSFTGMASVVDKQLSSATKRVNTLTRDQKRLTTQIKKAKLAGEDVSSLTKRYGELGHEIDEASTSARGFQSASNLRDSLKGAASYAVATTAGVVGLTGSVVGLTTATNAATAEQAGLAKAYGMSIEQFKAWGGIASQAGFDAETTGDLVEELSNKFGEFKALGEQSSVSDVFGALGIDSAMMDGLSAAEQFEFVMQRLTKVGDTQQAASLADMLFGGEGNKIVTYIKNSGSSLDELLKTQRGINNLTQEGADGALKYNKAWKGVTTALYSGWQDIAGVVGGEVAPIFDELGGTVNAFIRENRAEIVDFLKSAVEGSIAFAGGVVSLGGAVNDVVQFFGGWETVAAGVAGLMAGKMVVGIAGVVSNVRTMITTLGAVRTTMLGVNAVMAANPIGAVAAVVGLLTAAGVALYQNWDTVKEWFKSFFDWYIDKWKAVFSLGKKVKDFLSSIVGFGDDSDEEETQKTPPKKTGYHGATSMQSSVYNPYSYQTQSTDKEISQERDNADNSRPITSQPIVSKYVISTQPTSEEIPQERDNTGGYHSATSQLPTNSQANEAIQKEPSDNAYSYANRAQAVNDNAVSSTSTGGNTIHQNVEKIEIITTPDQSPEEIGQAVGTELSDHRDAIMFDLSSGD